MSEVHQEKDGLTVHQLVELLLEKSASGEGDWQVRLRVEKPKLSIGRAPTVDVTGVDSGFDWDRGTLFLSTVQPLGLDVSVLKEVRKQMSHVSDSLYSIGRVLKNDRFSSEEKLKQIQEWVEYVFPPRAPRESGT